MRHLSWSSLRVRLVLLVLAALVPAFAIMLFNGLQQRSDEEFWLCLVRLLTDHGSQR